MKVVVAGFRVEKEENIALAPQQWPPFCTPWYTGMPKQQPPALAFKDEGTQNKQQHHHGPYSLLTEAATYFAYT